MSNAPQTNRIQILLDAFQDYIQASRFIEVFTSQKFGHVYVYIDGTEVNAAQLQTANELFEHILYEMSHDVRNLFMCGEHDWWFLYPDEITECRRRLAPYLDRLPDSLKTSCTAQMDFFFAHCNDIYK